MHSSYVSSALVGAQQAFMYSVFVGHFRAEPVTGLEVLLFVERVSLS